MNGDRRAENIQAIEWQGRDLLAEIANLRKLLTEPERTVPFKLGRILASAHKETDIQGIVTRRVMRRHEFGFSETMFKKADEGHKYRWLKLYHREWSATLRLEDRNGGSPIGEVSSPD